MFEQILQRILAALGAGDQLIVAGGPTLTIIMAMMIGGALAQFLKFPLSRAVQDPWFSYLVRVIAVVSTFVFAHFLSETVPLWLQFGAAVLQPLSYRISLAIIRRFWPWLETKKYVGAVWPPDSAFQADAQRRADKAGTESGA